jgi:hypothetical protein
MVYRQRQQREQHDLLLGIFAAVQQRVKVLDLRPQQQHESRRLRGSHCVSHTTLWAENRW